MSKINIPQHTMLELGDIISLYYCALYSGDLGTVKDLMTQESYFMTLETFGLKLSLRDLKFKMLLKEIREKPASLTEVESKLSAELLSRNMAPKIEIESVECNGMQRQVVQYREDGKNKKLYFSQEENAWKINYHAGRRVN